MTNIKQYQATRWSLEKLIAAPSGEPVETLQNELETLTVKMEAFRPKLTPEISEADFIELLIMIEALSEVAYRLGAYGSLWFAEDTQDQTALAFMGKMEEELMVIQNRTLFVELWWKGLDDSVVERLSAHAGKLEYYLEKMRLYRDHSLLESEEKIINLKNVNGSNALITLYDMITNKFVFELTVDGEQKKLTRDELTAYVRSSSPEMRAAAYQELYRVYAQQDAVLTQIYIHRVRDWANENMTLRHYESPISVRNLHNDISDEVINTLLNVCAEQSQTFQKYFKLKAGWLGIDKLRRYDLYAPLNHKSNRKIEYADAIDMVLDSFQQFSPEVAKQAKRVFDDNHIDAEIRPGKRGGAFCASVLPQATPWVLVNYTGEPNQVATLAHELGHAVHAMLAENHSLLTFHSALPLAETASVFAEMLLTDRLLDETEDPNERRNLLQTAVDDSYATVMRQAYFVLFEREAHRLIAEGKTMDELNQHYMDNLLAQFGDSMDISDDFKREWIVIPHIYHTPFYCYAYSFGKLLALSLYKQYKNEGTSFTPKFIKILSYGGSAKPNHILTEAGIDMSNPDFWRGGFEVIQNMIDELSRT
ncbi:M3 family oligoendopeptidase [Anaerolineales bacterium HSG24]|nr:M3 family oligoendopeptidase [Anaerolineales bacterium HSG24]